MYPYLNCSPQSTNISVYVYERHYIYRKNTMIIKTGMLL